MRRTVADVSGQVRGFIGERAVEVVIARRGSAWNLNGVVVAGLDHLSDLDLVHAGDQSPAIQASPDGRERVVPLPVAWFDADAGVLTELLQLLSAAARMHSGIEREASALRIPRIVADGFIRNYPILWTPRRRPNETKADAARTSAWLWTAPARMVLSCVLPAVFRSRGFAVWALSTETCATTLARRSLSSASERLPAVASSDIAAFCWVVYPSAPSRR